jgi:hypothetical protein
LSSTGQGALSKTSESKPSRQYGPVGRGVGLLELVLSRPADAERRPSPEGRRLMDQAQRTASELGMLRLAQRAPA